jgi:hypothetical protein
MTQNLLIAIIIINFIIIGILFAKLFAKPKAAEKTEGAVRKIQKNPWKEKLKENGIDETKRRSLMPSSQAIIPKGYEKNEDGSLKVSDKLPERDYEFKFFGSQLLVESRAIITGLESRAHKIEILKDGQVFLDGVETKLIGADLDSIKQAVLMHEQGS